MKRLIFLTLVTFCTIASLSAQQISFEAIAPRGMVREGDKFALTFRLNNATATPPRQPQIAGCTFIYGPATSSRSSYSVINGAVTSSSSTDYVFTYRADKAGKVSVPALSVTVDGKRYTSRPIEFNIGNAMPRQQDPDQGQGRGNHRGNYPPVDMDDIATQSSGRAVNANDVFVRIILSKSQAYEQEAIVCTIKLYTKYQISSFMPTLQPSFDGFLIQELDVQPALNEVETLNGQNYMTAVLKKCILFPQRSGKLTINSGNYDITVVQYERINMGLMTVSNPTEKQIKVSSNTASANIQPLPTPQPEGFSGAVGTFNVDSRLVGTTFRTDDAATLIYTISGTGNIKYLKEPTLDFPTEFELYEPQSDIDTRVQGGNVSGTMTINYTFVPRQVGQFRIGSDKFVYFDPAKRQYVTLTTNPFDIKVSQGAGNAVSSRQDIASKNTDIRHIHLHGATPSHGNNLVIDRIWYWLLYLAAIGVLGGVFYTNRRHMRMAADVTGTRMARASKEARKRLRSAKGHMDSRDSDKFYEAVLQAMWGFLSDKLSMPASQLSRENVSEKLHDFGADDAVTDRLIAILDQCEMARYTPMGSDEQMGSLYKEASEVINALSSIRKK
ncbi:MAG: hypothetical protein C7K11_01940 [Candidatus Amulumruptor caecigallinarius]|nr:MAG: hypothetical protein C7K11_01940 [Candidatus Amulumruptor caecigallinarius]